MRKNFIQRCFGILPVFLFALIQSSLGQLVTNTNTSLTYSTIQAAIDAPQTLNGHILSVAAGTYVENIVVNKSLTINGPKAGVDGNNPARGTGEAIVQPSSLSFGGTFGMIVNITANDVTIDGLTVDGDNPALNGCDVNGANIDIDLGIFSYGGDGSTPDLSGDNIIIKNNVVKNIYWSAIGLGSGLSTLTSKYGQIKHNKIQNVAVGDGIASAQNYYTAIEFNTIIDTHWGMEIGFFFLQPLPGKSGSISNNTFTSKVLAAPCLSPWTDVRGILIYQLYNNITNAWSVTNNTFINNSTRSTDSRGFDLSINWSPSCLTIANNNVSGFESGYSIRNCGNSGNGLTPPTESLTISGGTVNNCSYGVLATNLSEYYGNAQSSIYNLNQVTLANNTIAGIFIDDESLNPINTNPSSVTVNVNNSKINGNPIGIKVSGSYAYATAHDNDLSGNSSFAINNLSPNAVDATCNWYGHGSGPAPGGSGSAVSSNVTFFPWLINGTDNDPVQGFQPVPGSCCTLTLTCPGNIQGNILLLCRGIASTPNPVINLSGSCNLTKLTWNMTGATTGSSPTSGIRYVGTRIFNAGTTTITYSATNNAGYSTSCSFTVTMVDNSSPFIFCPFNITTSATGNSCSKNINVPNPIVLDNCSVTGLSWGMTGATNGNSPATGINYVGNRSFNVGVTTVTYTAKDAANNATSCSFTVRVNGSPNCNNNSRQSGEITNSHPKGIANDKLEVRVYPNPAESYFTLEILSGGAEKMEISVFDATGRLMKKINTGSQRSIRFGDDLKPGLYMVEVRNGEERQTVKLIKQ